MIEVELPERQGNIGYSVECRYYYNKSKQKYHVSMWLKRKDINDTFKINSQQTDIKYIEGTKETIKHNICNVVEQAASFGFFDYFIERYKYTYDCFDKGNELFEKERRGEE